MPKPIHLTVDPTQLRCMAVGVAVLAKLGDAAAKVLADSGMPLGADPVKYAERLSMILEACGAPNAGHSFDLTGLQKAEESQ